MKTAAGEVAAVIGALIFLGTWVFGIAAAKGFWMTLACLFPPVAWAVLAQRLMGW